MPDEGGKKRRWGGGLQQPCSTIVICTIRSGAPCRRPLLFRRPPRVARRPGTAACFPEVSHLRFLALSAAASRRRRSSEERKEKVGIKGIVRIEKTKKYVGRAGSEYSNCDQKRRRKYTYGVHRIVTGVYQTSEL